MSERVSTEIKCSDCGKTATVYFKPNPDRPIYCRVCLAKHRTPMANPTNRMEPIHSHAGSEKQAWSRRHENWK
jgi:CxxC-x17-CxxC domain-containing protein